jgi:hypothetical protein
MPNKSLNQAPGSPVGNSKGKAGTGAFLRSAINNKGWNSLELSLFRSYKHLIIK